jgi:hypothetical protein
VRGERVRGERVRGKRVRGERDLGGVVVEGDEEAPYSGVVPGSKNPPPGKKGKRPSSAKRCELLWLGFQMKKQGSVVFLQLNERVKVDVESAGKKMVLTFPGCRIPLRNNRRRLVTRYFPTPVSQVRAKSAPKGAQVVVELKSMVFPVRRWRKLNGYYFLFLEFGGGEAGRAGEEVEPAEPGEPGEPSEPRQPPADTRIVRGGKG